MTFTLGSREVNGTRSSYSGPTPGDCSDDRAVSTSMPRSPAIRSSIFRRNTLSVIVAGGFASGITVSGGAGRV